MFNYWRGWQNYMLLFAIVFKSLILGALFTLAIHNICLREILSEDFSWQRSVVEKRKRNDENSFLITFNAGEAIETENISLKGSFFICRILHAFYLSFVKCSHTINNPVYRKSRYIPERIFLQHCSLLR